MVYPIGITKSLQTWDFQGNHVERPLDNAAYDAAHPDDTLILAGPARRGRPGSANPRSMLAMGMFQGFSIGTQVSLTPVMAIGSGRSFFLRGKSQSNWSIQRAMINGRNLLRVLQHSAVDAGLDVHRFDDPAALSRNSQFFTNLDSELFYIPFGMAVTVRSKSHTLVASMYLELCMISSWGTQIAAGQNMIAESVTGLCDRVLPFQATDAMNSPRVSRVQMDAVLGLANDVFPAMSNTTISEIDDTGLDNGTVRGVGG